VTDSPPPPPAVLPFTRAWMVGAAVFAAFLAVGGPVQQLNVAFGLWFTQLVVFLGVPWVLLRALGVSPARATGLDSTRAPAVGLGFSLGLVNYVAWAVPLMALVHELLPPSLVEAHDAAQGRLFQQQTVLEQVLFVAGVTLAAPLCEEFFFRGVILRGLLTRLSPPRAIVVTALVFSAFHFDPVGAPALFELGVLFGLLAWRSGSIWPSVAAHAASNLAASGLYFAGPEGDDTALPWTVLGGLLLAGNVGLLLLARAATGKLLGPRPAAEVPAPVVPVGRGLLRLALPAAAVLGLYLALDWRGVLLRAQELRHPLPPHVTVPPELEALRQRARAGEVPLDDYLEARSLLGPPTGAR
jgi:uncharacterized protein